MPERGFNTDLWNDAFVRKLPKDAKLLFIYLWTNPHCNQAGLYEIDLETIAFDTKLIEADIPALFELLEPKVKWYPEVNLVWVKNFIKRQTKSPKFLIAAAKCLSFIHHNGAIQELIQYNYSTYSISIPYPYSSNTNSIPSSASASASADLLSNALSSREIGVPKGEEGFDIMRRLYEENIGIMTPLVADELKDLLRTYPVNWFEETVKEAVKANHRNLKYIKAILARWGEEGFKAPKASNRQGRKVHDPDKYIKDKYGHLVHR
jgi:DnaD/phage-associated family protein